MMRELQVPWVFFIVKLLHMTICLVTWLKKKKKISTLNPYPQGIGKQVIQNGLLDPFVTTACSSTITIYIFNLLFKACPFLRYKLNHAVK